MPQNTHFLNNIFYVDGRVTYDWGNSTQNVFENNVFFGNHQGRPARPGASIDKPPLMNPGSGAGGFDSLAGYKLRPGVPFARGRVSFRTTAVAISSVTPSPRTSHRCQACMN